MGRDGCSFGDVQSCGLGGWVQFWLLFNSGGARGMGVALATVQSGQCYRGSPCSHFGDSPNSELWFNHNWVQFRLCSGLWYRGMGVALAMFKVAV